MLRALHRVLKPGGRIGYLVIAVADDLEPRARTAALEAGPIHVDADPGYSRLMEMSGFTEIDLTDVTSEYATTIEAWHREWDADAVELIELIGPEEHAERQSRRRGAMKAVAQGRLRRLLVTARRA